MSRTHRDGGITSGWFKSEQKQTSRRERMLKREFCTLAKVDEDAPLTYDIEARDPMYRRGWNGYWRPLRRWLNSHVGEAWNQVYSQCVAKLKVFYAANAEMSLRKNILNMVEVTPNVRFPENTSYFQWEFYVDDNGLLQRKTVIPRIATRIPKFNTEKIATWLNGRVVGRRSNQLYWFLPTTGSKKYGRQTTEWKCEWVWKYGSRGLRYLYKRDKVIYDKDNKITGHEITWEAPFSRGLSTRQSVPLDKDDLAFWNSIPTCYQTKVLDWSPLEDNVTNLNKDLCYSWW